MDDEGVAALAAAERQMAAEAEHAAVRYAVQMARLRAAGAELGALTRPTWGGPVDQWHNAADAVADAAETVAAYEHFGVVGLR